MAIFKVLNQRELERKSSAETSTFCLVVVPIDGQIEPGLEFIGYDTHHPFTVVVRSVQEDDATLLLACEATWPVYEHIFDSAVVNTSGTMRHERFFYDHDNKHGSIAL